MTNIAVSAPAIGAVGASWLALGWLGAVGLGVAGLVHAQAPAPVAAPAAAPAKPAAPAATPAPGPSLFGLPFDDTLDRNLIQCPSALKNTTHDYCAVFDSYFVGVSSTDLMLKPPVGEAATKLGVPAWVNAESMVLVRTEAKGKITSIRMQAPGGVAGQQPIMDAITAKFGPAGVENTTAPSSYGPPVPYKRVTWRNKQTVAVYACTKKEECFVSFMTPAEYERTGGKAR